MTSHQLSQWVAAALEHMSELSDYIFLEEDYPIPIRYCDGHMVHTGDLRDLHQQFLLAARAAYNRIKSEDTRPLVTEIDVFVAIYGMIANAQRVTW